MNSNRDFSKIAGRPADIAERYGITKQGLATMRYEGRGPCYIKKRDFIFYRYDDVDKWLESGRIETADSEEL